ncbi:MAG: type II toxin-antitoxin system RelE/ParE family toxin [Cellvibrionaceae bacterium]|nr:type II toxin-antitoxin system RelE/ParE family toxin [Cellvibrionaceae bacterium]
MPRKIIWLPGASRDVARLRDFLTSKNPIAAQRAAKRIVEGVMILKDNPGTGSPVDTLMKYREIKLSFGSGDYIIRYREEYENVVIMRVRHSKEKSF